jgi:hypothetical protein
MRTGNIVKTFYGDVVIISNVRDNYVSWISANHSNSSGGTQIITTEDEVVCDCLIECCEPSIDCPDCKGTGMMTKTIHGMDKATYLADNMFDYIKKRMLMNFDF